MHATSPLAANSTAFSKQVINPDVAARRAIGVARVLALTKNLHIGCRPFSKQAPGLTTAKTVRKDELKIVSEPEEVPRPPMEVQELRMVGGIGMEKGNSHGSGKGVEDWESDSTLPGMPTAAQLADLEAAILLHKEAATSKDVVKVQRKRWTRRGSRLGKELPGMPTTAQLAQLESANILNKAMRWPTVGIVMVQDGSVGTTNSDAVAALPAALPIAPLLAPLEAPLGFLSDQQWDDLDAWFNENVGIDGDIREEAAVVGVVGGDQPVAAPEGQWEQQNVPAEMLEEPKAAVGDQGETRKEDLFSFLDDILANLPQY
ncbi:hypothetical protein HDU80_001559, partial [Chytriomyces hyalinus]